MTSCLLVSSGLAILSTSTNISLDTFGQPDILANYGKESLLPNLQGLELDFLSIESLAEALSSSMESLTVVPSSLEYVWYSLEDLGNETLKGLSGVVSKISVILDDVFTSCCSVFSDTILNVEEAFINVVNPFIELCSAFSIIITGPESASDTSSRITEESAAIPIAFEEDTRFYNQDDEEGELITNEEADFMAAQRKI